MLCWLEVMDRFEIQVNYALGEAVVQHQCLGKTSMQSFTAGSSVAYLGTDDGQIWKYYADTFTLLNDEASSRISRHDCLKNKNICVLSTLNDGIAVIDQADTVTWFQIQDSIRGSE